MATGYVSYAAPIASSAASLGATQPAAATSAAVTAPVANQQASTAPAGNAAVNTGFDPQPAVVGGGAVSNFIGNAATQFATMASNGMQRLEAAMNGDIAANGGQLNPAKMQQYTSQMNTFEQVMLMAKKIQDKQEAAANVWLR